MKTQKGWYGNIAMIGVTIVMFITVGYGGTTALFLPAMAEQTGISAGLLSYQSLFSTVSSGIIAIFVGKMMQKFGVKHVVMLGVLAMGVGGIILSFQSSLAGLFGCSIIAGIGFGCTTQTGGAALIGAWFIKKRSTMVGIVYAIAGLGSAFWLWLTGVMLNQWSWNLTRLVSAIIVLAVSLVGFLIYRSPDQINQKPLGWEDAQEDGGSKQKENTELYGVTFMEALKTPSFWMLFAAIACSSILMMTWKSYSSYYWQYERGVEALTTSQWLTIFSIFTCVGQYVMGWFQQKVGNKIYIVVEMACFLIGTIFITRGPADGGAIFWVIMFICALSYPTANTLGAVMTTESFGPRDYNKIMSLMVTAVYIGFALCSVIGARVYAGTGSFASVYDVLIVFALVALVLHLLSSFTCPMREHNKQEKMKQKTK